MLLVIVVFVFFIRFIIILIGQYQIGVHNRVQIQKSNTKIEIKKCLSQNEIKTEALCSKFSKTHATRAFV